MNPFRLEPQLPAEAVKTYAVYTPLKTHFRSATCAEVGCPHYLAGWRTIVDESTDLGKRQAGYIRTKSGRAFTEVKNQSGLTEFLFKPGQTCFSSHKKKMDYDPICVVKDGDWRGNPRGTDAVIHKRSDIWVEDFAEHQDRLADRLERG